MTDKKDVVVLGSLHLDVMVRAPRLPMIGETLPGEGWSFKCGGKGGNQAVAAARHGAATAFVGRIGADSFGEKLKENLIAQGVDVAGLRTDATAGSGMSAALLRPDGDYAAVIVSGVNLHIDATDLAAATRRLRTQGVLVLQNEIPHEANRAASAAAKAAGALCLLNAAPARPLDHPVDLLVVNAVEAEMLGAAPVNDLASAARAAEQLLTLAPATVVTAGPAGVAHATAEGDCGCIPPRPVAVASTHGAGDEFVGALAARLASGEGLGAACAYANEAAAVLVATPEAERRQLSATMHGLAKRIRPVELQQALDGDGDVSREAVD